MPAVGEIYQYTFGATYQGQLVENVIHMRARSAIIPTDAALKASADAWLLLQSQVQVVAVVYRPVRIKRMTPIAFDEITYIPAIVTGAQSIGGVNTTLAVVITKRTGVAGKTHRGRLYLGGYPATWGVDFVNIAPGPTLLGTFAGQLLATFGEGGTDPTVSAGVYSRTIGGSFPFTLPGWQQITRWDPQLLVGNQRRRRQGVGA
jgi:hypothetical protein